MASFFSFSSPVDVDVRLENEDARKQVEIKMDKQIKEKCPVYFDGEGVKGSVSVRMRDGKKLVHDGIKIEFVGSIEMFYDRGNRYEFLSLVQELASPGEMRAAQHFDFEFKNVEKQYESYNGINVKLRYFIRVTISRRLADVVKERDTWVHSYRMPPDSNNAIKMEVGIEDCLHIEFEYNKSKYHLKDVIVGKIYFLLVRIKIKHMELSIIRRETTGAAPNQYNESETITKFEIMDGAPVRGETIPIRLFLGGFELTPTFRDVNKKFSTRYYLNLVLIDEENRRYFKQQEITVLELVMRCCFMTTIIMLRYKCDPKLFPVVQPTQEVGGRECFVIRQQDQQCKRRTLSLRRQSKGEGIRKVRSFGEGMWEQIRREKDKGEAKPIGHKHKESPPPIPQLPLPNWFSSLEETKDDVTLEYIGVAF